MAIEPMEARRLLSSAVVNTTLDQVDPAGSGTVSLRDAIAIANAATTDTEITFDPAVFATPQTITLDGTELLLNNGNEITTITGPAAGVTLDANNLSSVIETDGCQAVTLQNLTITGGNTGSYGGGVNNQYDGTLTLIDDSIAGNFAASYGGGINSGGTLVLTNDTITDNTSAYEGGGIWDISAVGTFTNLTVAGNTAPLGGGLATVTTVDLANSILAGNSVTAGGTDPDVSGAVTSLGHNLIGDIGDSTGWTAPDLTGTTASPLDAKLGSLAHNAGPTQTLLPLTGSPALNAGSISLIPSGVDTDQRGYTRTVNNAVDIGEVESEASGPPVTAAPVKTIGGLDPTYGIDGLASHDVGFTSTSGVATFGTQSILIGPVGTSPNQSFGVTRYNGDGSLDTTFGAGGVTSTNFGSTDDVPTAVDVLGGGDILVAGTATTPGAGSEFAIAEYTPTGTLDTRFGTGGEVLVSFSTTAGTPSDDMLHAMTVAPNGTIFLGGSIDAAGAGNTDFAIAALTPSGRLQTGFHSTGTALYDVTGGDDVIHSLAAQSSGDVVAAGSAVVNGVTQVALARLLPTGSLDKRFSKNGIVTNDVGGVFDSASSVLIQPKGQIVVGGLTASGSGASLTSDFLLQRYTAAGVLDRTFAGGTVTTSFGQPAAVTQLALQADGSIVASGKTASSLGGALDVAVARYTARGALDGSFGTGGKVIIDLGSGVVASATPQNRLAATLSAALSAAASTLGAEFDAFTSSLQGVVVTTQGGEILTAGISGANTVEAELVAAGIDLVASVLSALPASVLGGVKGKLSVSITESGTTAAKGSVTIAISFASSVEGTDASASVSYSERISLKQSQSKTFKLSITFPVGLPGGAYYAIADVTDGVGLASDLNADNNQSASSATVNIAPPFVTLTGSSLASGQLTEGKSVAITIDITNGGNVTAEGKTDIDFYLSGDDTVADGTLLGSVPLGVSLPAGKGKPFRVKLAVPGGAPAGTFNLLGVIDPNNVLGTDDVLVVAGSPVKVSA